LRLPFIRKSKSAQTVTVARMRNDAARIKRSQANLYASGDQDALRIDQRPPRFCRSDARLDERLGRRKTPLPKVTLGLI